MTQWGQHISHAGEAVPRKMHAGLRWVSVRATDSLYRLLNEIAEREQRSVSNLISVLIIEALRARGEQLPEQATPPDSRRAQRTTKEASGGQDA